MSTKAAAVDLLINKGNFEPQAALALVQAIVMILTDSQLVTIPVLDARLADLRTGLRAEIANLEKRTDLLEQRMENTTKRLEDLIVTTNEVTIARLEKAIEATKSELVRWVFLAMVGSGAIQAAASAIINALR